MTIINGIEIDDIEYKTNSIKESILNNDPIEEFLHVIAVVSNPCLFARRYILMREFIHRIEREETKVKLYIVELSYKDQKFIITDAKNPEHLQLRTDCPLWHKENMINLGVKHLLPANYKAFAWIDADIEFENPFWATDTLKILNGTKDIVQLYSHAVDMDRDESTMSVFNSAAYKYIKSNTYVATRGLNYSHPGYAWAITRKAYEKMGGLYDMGILGSGDYIMFLCLMNKATPTFAKTLYSSDFKKSISKVESRMKNIRLGYVPGVIRHHFHGSKINRKYQDRNIILRKYDYSPYLHIMYDERGLIIPSPNFPEEFKEEIMKYFEERMEDD